MALVNSSSDLAIPTSNYTESWSAMDNSSETVPSQPIIPLPLGPFDRYIDEIPLFGFPGPIFWSVHCLGIICLIVSILVSVTLISYICISRRREEPLLKSDKVGKPDKNPKNFFKANQTSANSFHNWNIGERLVIYLATTDLLTALSHINDHSYVLAKQRNPPDLMCALFSFFLQEFCFAQWCIILYTALSASSLIVFGKKLHLGRYDWRLLVSAYGAPFIVLLVSFRLGFLGQNGIWWESFIAFRFTRWFILWVYSI